MSNRSLLDLAVDYPLKLRQEDSDVSVTVPRLTRGDDSEDVECITTTTPQLFLTPLALHHRFGDATDDHQSAYGFGSPSTASTSDGGSVPVPLVLGQSMTSAAYQFACTGQSVSFDAKPATLQFTKLKFESEHNSSLQLLSPIPAPSPIKPDLSLLIHHHHASLRSVDSDDSQCDDGKDNEDSNPNDDIESDSEAETDAESDADSDSESDSDMGIMALLVNLNSQNEDLTLAEHGYRRIDKMCDALQGELIKAEVIASGRQVAVKKVCKRLSADKQASPDDDDDMMYMVQEDIEKEAAILQHLTSDHGSDGKGIASFVEWFDSDSHWYLVTEYVHGVTLREFVDTAFEHITAKRLSYTKYRQCQQPILLQLIETISWLHGAFKCCHLDLNLDNILVHGVEFEEVDNEKYTIRIAGAPKVKLVDFGLAEIINTPRKPSAFQFQGAKNGGFNVDPEALSVDRSYAPDTMRGRYDARGADMWSLGVLMFNIVVGSPLYSASDIWDDPQGGYAAVRNGRLREYLAKQKLLGLFERDSFSLLQAMLHKNPNKRISADAASQHPWFDALRNSDEHHVDLKETERIVFPFYKAQ